MRKTSLIGHIVELHEAIRQGNGPADRVVAEFFRTRHYLGAKDRHFISEAVYGIIRNQILLELFVEEARRAGNPLLLTRPVPSLALYIAYAARVLQESTETVRSDVTALARVYLPDLDCSAFLQALLESEMPADIVTDPVRRIATRHSFPEFIVSEWVRRFGEVEAEVLCDALNQAAPITLRVNTLRVSVDECRRQMAHEGILTDRTSLSPVGLLLEKRVNINALQSFRNGLFEMQDEGSQLLSLLLDPRPGDNVVDACAGAGGKTLHLAALMKNTGSLLAVDVAEHRLRNLRGRLGRAGISIVTPCLAGRDDKAIAEWNARADRVLVDAPCTGSGTFRRNPYAKILLTEEMLVQLCRTQESVLDRYAALVKPGGRLVYATCSLLESENEHQVDLFLATHKDFSLLSARNIMLDQGVNVEPGGNFLTLLPHKHSTDGFFAAAMVRRNDN